VRIAIRQAIAWHAENGLSNTKRAATAALKTLVTSPDDELALCLHDGWGRLGLRASHNYEEAERARTAEFRRIAEALVSGHTEAQVLERLEERLHIERAALDGINSSGRFLWEVFSVKPDLAAHLCKAALTGHYPELSQFVASALAVLANAGDPRAITFAVEMVTGESPSLRRAAATALSWNRGGRVALLPGETDLLAELAEHEDEHVRAAMGRAVYLIALSDKAVAVDLLSRIKFGQSAKLAAETLSAFTLQGPLSWTDTDGALRKAILAQLVDCDSIDEYELTSALSELSKIDPLRVTKFLIARIERGAANHELRYDPLPHDWDPPLQVQTTNKLARCLAEVRAWMTSVDGDDRSRFYLHDRGAQLYALLAGTWNDQALAVLADVENATSLGAVLAVARILAHAPSTVLFEHVQLVTKVLRRAQTLGREEAKVVFQALLPSNYGVFTSWSGEPDDKDVRERDRARHTAKELPRGSIESRFFNTLADAVDARITFRSERPERRYDGREW
jgi:hypothetical protein